VVAAFALVHDPSVEAGSPYAGLFAPYFEDQPVEWVLAAGLDRTGRLVAFDGQGDAPGSNAHLITCVRGILGHPRVATVVVGHNHVAGPPTPSREDLSATRRAADLCRLAHARLLDHLIFAPSGSVSLRALGHLG
jgi:DNA repair protein RadC